MRRLLISCSLAALLLSCGGGGTVKTLDTVDGTSGADTDVWPEDLYRGEVDLFFDTAAEDLDVPPIEDVPLTYDTDYVPDDAIVFHPDTEQELYVDGVCVPDCKQEDGTAKECGPDGCGSLCGVCGFGFECSADQLCIVECLADCVGRECGPDPLCMESCGECEEGFQCNPAGKCEPICDPLINCAGKDCGSDGCGGSCGICPGNEVCTADQQCEPHPCGNVQPLVGKCDQDLLIHCVDDVLVQVNCKDYGEDFWCGFDGQEGVYECKQGCEPICEFPNGNPKECGYDGCYGTCGACPTGWDCVSGLCNPNQGASCGWIPATGSCFEEVLWICDGGILYLQDCAAQGLTCKYNMSISAYECSI